MLARFRSGHYISERQSAERRSGKTAGWLRRGWTFFPCPAKIFLIFFLDIVLREFYICLVLVVRDLGSVFEFNCKPIQKTIASV